MKLNLLIMSLVLAMVNLISVTTANASNGRAVVMKVRALVAIPENKETFDTPLVTTNLTKTNKKFLKNGVGADAAATFFVNDYLGIEAGMSILAHRMAQNVNTNSILGATNMFTQTALTKKEKRRRDYIIPFTLIAQYHPMPGNQVSPYLGAGMHYSVVSSASGVASFKNYSGAVAQLGVDVWDAQDLAFNIDVKKYFGKSKYKYKALHNSITGTQLSGSVKTAPVVVSTGVAWKL